MLANLKHSVASTNYLQTVASCWNTKLSIDIGQVLKPTKQGLGYHVQGCQRYYWHHPEQDANSLTWVLFSYAPSTYCEERMDVQKIQEVFPILQQAKHGEFWRAVVSLSCMHRSSTRQMLIQALLARKWCLADWEFVYEDEDLLKDCWQASSQLESLPLQQLLVETGWPLPEILWWQWFEHAIASSQSLHLIGEYIQKTTIARWRYVWAIIHASKLNLEQIHTYVLPKNALFLTSSILAHPQCLDILRQNSGVFHNHEAIAVIEASLPSEPECWPEILSAMPSSFQHQFAKKHAFEHFDVLYSFLDNEQVVLDYVMDDDHQISLFTLEDLMRIAHEKVWFHLWYALTILIWKAKAVSITMAQLIQLNDAYVKALFEDHSMPLRKIQSPIFAPCFKHSFSGTWCEGKAWYRNDDKKITTAEKDVFTITYKEKIISHQWLPKPRQPKSRHLELKILCRRKSCNEYRVGHISIYQKLLLKIGYAGIDKLMQLSQDKAETQRHIGALNRWNEVLDRLQCRSCLSVLMLSEHSTNSLGRMAYAATYWRCSNEQCLEHSQVVKITHCVGCSSIIDSRDNHQACNPFETLSYKKFYLCNTCGCCCKSHGYFLGKCPECGQENAFSATQEADRTHAKCVSCGHEVSIEKRAFQHYQKQLNRTNHSKNAINWSSEISYIESSKSMGKSLYVADLYKSLCLGELSLEKLKGYTQIYDLKILNKITHLGKFHSRYLELDGASLEYDLDLHEWSEIPENWRLYFIELAHFVFKQPQLSHYYNLVELPFTLALYSYTQHGIGLGRELLVQVHQQLELARNRLSFSLRDSNGFFANQQSVIDDYLQINQAIELTLGHKREPMLNKFLKNAPDHEISKRFYALEKIDRVRKLLSTFVDADNGMVMPQYQIIGTVTGRCTAKKPALMSSPKVFRSLFAHQKGFELYSFDYAQIEIGILAALSKDEMLLNDYNNSDVYQELADETDLSRDAAKMLMLSMIYGITETQLARLIGLSEANIHEIQQQITARYPQVATYRNECQQQLQTEHFVQNRFGLKRYRNSEVAMSPQLKQWECNWAFNFPIQSTAAAIFKLALVSIHEQDQRRSMRMVCPLYDEFLVQIPTADVAYYVPLIHSCMVHTLQRHFPCLQSKVSIENYQEQGENEFHSNAWLHWLHSLAQDANPVINS